MTTFDNFLNLGSQQAVTKLISRLTEHWKCKMVGDFLSVRLSNVHYNSLLDKLYAPVTKTILNAIIGQNRSLPIICLYCTECQAFWVSVFRNTTLMWQSDFMWKSDLLSLLDDRLLITNGEEPIQISVYLMTWNVTVTMMVDTMNCLSSRSHVQHW